MVELNSMFYRISDYSYSYCSQSFKFLISGTQFKGYLSPLSRAHQFVSFSKQILSNDPRQERGLLYALAKHMDYLEDTYYSKITPRNCTYVQCMMSPNCLIMSNT